jgi:hypothetical protein
MVGEVFLNPLGENFTDLLFGKQVRNTLVDRNIDFALRTIFKGIANGLVFFEATLANAKEVGVIKPLATNLAPFGFNKVAAALAIMVCVNFSVWLKNRL